MSKKSVVRRKKDYIARNDSELTPSVRAAKRNVYVLLCVGLLVIPFGFSWIPGMYNASFYLTILVAAGLSVTLLWAVHKKAVTPCYTPFFVVLGLWVAAKLLTTATSILPYHSFWGTYKNWSDGFMFAFAAAVIAAVVVTLRLDARRIIRLIGLLTSEAVVFAAVTIGQAVGAGVFYQKVRPNSPLENADYFLSYLLLFLPVLLVLFFTYLRKRQWWRMTVSGIGSLIMLMALFVSMPTHLQTILLPAFENGKIDSTSGAGDTQSISAGNFTQDDANVERWTEWRFGLHFGLTRPLVGTGPSTTGESFQAAQVHHTIDLQGWNSGVVMDHSHSDLIEQFSQEGLIGLAVYVGFWVVFVAIIVRRYRLIDPQLRRYAIGLGVGLVLWLGFNQLLFTTVVAGVIMLVWVGLLLTMVKSQRPVTGRAPVILLGLVTLILVAGSIWVGKYYVDDTMVDVAILTNNQLLTQQSSDSQAQWVHDSQMAVVAAKDMPSEPYYDEMAAMLSIEAYGQDNNPGDQKMLASNALSYARKMLAGNPNSVEFMQTLGTVQYVVSPVGSSAAQAGLAEIDRAISYAPNDPGSYMSAAGNAAAKKDYVTARKLVKAGMAAHLKPADKRQLSKLAASWPAP